MINSGWMELRAGGVIMKTKFGAYPYIYPVPIVLAGANVAGRPKSVTLGA
jgi:hypothetical protein